MYFKTDSNTVLWFLATLTNVAMNRGVTEHNKITRQGSLRIQWKEQNLSAMCQNYVITLPQQPQSYSLNACKSILDSLSMQQVLLAHQKQPLNSLCHKRWPLVQQLCVCVCVSASRSPEGEEPACRADSWGEEAPSDAAAPPSTSAPLPSSSSRAPPHSACQGRRGSTF